MTEDLVTSTTTMGRVTPAVRNFAAQPAGGVAVPRRHAEALQSHPEERRWNVRVAGGRGGREPCACARCAAGIEVEAAGLGEARILEKRGDGVGLDLAQQGLLRRDVGLIIDTATRDDGTEGGLGSSETAPLIQF